MEVPKLSQNTDALETQDAEQVTYERRTKPYLILVEEYGEHKLVYFHKKSGEVLWISDTQEGIKRTISKDSRVNDVELFAHLLINRGASRSQV